MKATIHILGTGVANLASVKAAFVRQGLQVKMVEEPEEILQAERVMMPGVGAFAAGVESLRGRGWTQPLRERLRDPDLPTMAICLGLQLLAQASEESPGEDGLGIVEATVTRFEARPGLLIPQLGWNHVQPQEGCQLVEEGYAYFANSYKLDAIPAGWSGAMSTHGRPFVAAMEREHQLVCQFHPELSGEWGAALIERWLGR